MDMRKRILVAGGALAVLISATQVSALSNDEVLAQIQNLSQVIAALQAQIQSLQNIGATVLPSPSLPAPSPGCIALTSSAGLGQRDSDAGGTVSILQQYLQYTGDYTYPEITGYFGAATEKALQRFQARSGIVFSGAAGATGYGVLGPKTRAYIQTASCGARAVSPIPVVVPPPPATAGCLIDGITVEDGFSTQLFSTRTVSGGASCSQYAATRKCANGALSGDATYAYASCAVVPGTPCTIGGLSMASGESRTFYDTASVSAGNQCAAHTQVRKCTNGTLSGSPLFSIASCTGPLSCTLDGVTLNDSQSQSFYFLQHIPFGELCSAYSASRTCTNGALGGDLSYKYSSCAPVTRSSCTADNVVLESGSSTRFFSAIVAPAGQACSSIAQTRSCTNGSLSGSASYNRASCLDTLPCLLDGVSVAHASSSVFYSAQSVGFGTTCSSVSQARACTNASLSGNATYKYATCAVAPPSSCTLDGTTLATGSSGTFYNARSVAYGGTCSSAAQTRTCTNGVLGGASSYQYASCDVSPPPTIKTEGS